MKPPIALAEVQGYVYDAKLRMAGLARVRGEDELARRLDRRGRRRCGHGSRRRSGSRTGPTTRWPSTPTSTRPTPSPRTPGSACGAGIVAPERARRRRRPTAGPGHVLGLGHPHVRIGPAGLQPDRLSHGLGLAARHVAHRRRPQALRLPRRGEPSSSGGSSRRPSTSRTSACRSCSAASTGRRRPSRCHIRSPARRRPGRPGRPFLFLQTMLGLQGARRPRRAGAARPQLPDWLSKVTVTNLRVGDAAVDLLFHRWRGTTSAEVLRKVGDVAVTIRI